jgi:hypothetical protein
MPVEKPGFFVIPWLRDRENLHEFLRRCWSAVKSARIGIGWQL